MQRKLRPLDEFDRTSLQSVYEKPGMCIRDYLRDRLLELSEPAGRNRFRDLELRGLVRLQKTKHDVLVWPTEALKMMFTGSLQAINTETQNPTFQESSQ